MKLVNGTHRFLALFVGLAMLVPLFSSSFSMLDKPFEGKQATENQMNKKMEITMTRIAQSIRERGESWVKQFKITKGTEAQDTVTIREGDDSNLLDLQDGPEAGLRPLEGLPNILHP